MPPRDVQEASRDRPETSQRPGLLAYLLTCLLAYLPKDTQPRLRPRLHSQPCTANVTQPRLCPRLHIDACIAKVTQSRIRSQGYAAKVTQPRLRPRLHCQDYTSQGDIIQVSKHPLFGVARWSHFKEGAMKWQRVWPRCRRAKK